MAKRQNTRKALVVMTFLLFPIIIFYFSPYIIIQGASAGIVTGSFIMFACIFILSLIFGRSLCGYVCPIGGLQECLMIINNKKVKGGKLNFIKIALWIPWLISIIILFIRAGGFLEFNFFFFISKGVSLTEHYTYIIYYGVIFLIVILSLIIGKRSFCHYVCWISPFMIIGTKIANLIKLPVIHLKTEKIKCIGCNRCSEKCPMSLEVRQMVENEIMVNSECILCGECIDICSKKAITYSFRRK